MHRLAIVGKAEGVYAFPNQARITGGVCLRAACHMCVCVLALGLGLAEVPGRTEGARRRSAPGTIYSPQLLMQEAVNTVKSNFMSN